MLFKLTSSFALVKCTMYMCGDSVNPIIDPTLWCQTNLDYGYTQPQTVAVMVSNSVMFVCTISLGNIMMILSSM